jgi:hypothetical protein
MGNIKKDEGTRHRAHGALKNEMSKSFGLVLRAFFLAVDTPEHFTYIHALKVKGLQRPLSLCARNHSPQNLFCSFTS